MRAAIRQLLVTNVNAVSGRIYEPHAAGRNTQKPYLVLREGVQDVGGDWAAFSTVIEVWPYASRTSFQQVDSLANAVINALHRARFSESGEQYLADYIGTTGPDYVDEEWDAITRGLRFRVFALGWLSGTTYSPDPVSVLRAWVNTAWANQVYTDPSTWSPVDDKPGIYWRLVRMALIESMAAVNWMEAQINGHIIAPSASTRLYWLRQVAEGLAKQRKLLMTGNGFLELVKVVADSEADPMRRGQVQLTVRFGVLQPAATYEVLRGAAVSGDASGVVGTVTIPGEGED